MVVGQSISNLDSILNPAPVNKASIFFIAYIKLSQKTDPSVTCQISSSGSFLLWHFAKRPLFTTDNDVASSGNFPLVKKRWMKNSNLLPYRWASSLIDYSVSFLPRSTTLEIFSYVFCLTMAWSESSVSITTTAPVEDKIGIRWTTSLLMQTVAS